MVALVLAGCSQVAPRSDESKEDAVAVAAKTRWDLLVEGKITEAYEFLSPATKSLLSLEKYQASIKPGIWRRVQVNNVNCDSDELCSVSLDVTYVFKPRGVPAQENSSLLTETWRKDSGRWWYVPSL